MLPVAFHILQVATATAPLEIRIFSFEYYILRLYELYRFWIHKPNEPNELSWVNFRIGASSTIYYCTTSGALLPVATANAAVQLVENTFNKY